MVKSCLPQRERLKRYILVHILLNKELSLVARWPEPAAFGGNRNPPESGGFRGKYRNSCPTGIPAKNSCKNGKKQEFLRPLQNHIPVKNSSGKRRKKRNHQESWQERFLGPKN
jgi:hypothetical protein